MSVVESKTMPTYDFRCPAGHNTERFFRKISDAPAELACPECGELAVRQVSGGAGLLFKGSGFYITDYGKDGKKDQRKPPSKEGAGGSSEKGGESASPKGGEKGAESKSSEKSSPPPTKPSSGSSSGE
jgi:putative FmdB family regulatory protein